MVYGLDSATGRLAWRCDGPGRAIGLSGASEKGSGPFCLKGPEGASHKMDLTPFLPSVWYHTVKPQGNTICRQALPVDADGKYLRPSAKPVVYGPPPVDNWAVRPLPWECLARKRLTGALLPGLACLGLVGFCALRRKWWTTAGVLACLLVVPLLVAWAELRRLSAGQHYAWDDWYLIWPHALSVPQDVTVGSLFLLALLATMVVFVLLVPRKWRWIAVSLLFLGLVCLSWGLPSLRTSVVTVPRIVPRPSNVSWTARYTSPGALR